MTPHEAYIRAQLIRWHRTAKGLVSVMRRHVPRWMAAVITVALLIPGPQDELAVLVILVVFAAFKPAMRSDIRATMRDSWNIYR